MKMTLVGPVYPYRGGITHYTSMLAKSFVDNGHKIQLISFKRQYPSWLYPGKSDRDPSLNPLKIEAEFILDPFYPWTWLSTVRRIGKFHPDIVIFQWWTTFWAFPFTYITQRLRQWKLPIVYLIHNVLPHEQRFFDTWLTRSTLKFGDHFIVHTLQEKKRLLELLPNAFATVSPFPVFEIPVAEKISKDKARERLNLPKNETILLFFGIIRRYKGLSHLIKALDILRKKGQHPLLIIAGEFWEDKTKYINKINSLDLSHQIILMDRYIPNEEVNYLFAATDLMIAPYTGGTQSAAVALATSFGLPIIASDKVTDGISESFRTAIVSFPSGNIESLAEAITAYLEYPGRIKPINDSLHDEWTTLVQNIEKFVS